MRVIKIGGNELDQPEFLPRLARLIAKLYEPVVIVHGGGRAIADLQARLGLKTRKVDGLRVTDAASLTVAQMVLSGQVNKEIVSALLAVGVNAVGLSGVDGGLLRCRPKKHPTTDLGFVGEVTQVQVSLLQMLWQKGITAVISPISLGENGRPYNVNADEAASAIAAALPAHLLDFISNVPGILHHNQLIPQLTPQETENLIATGIIRDGMIPKARAALSALLHGVSNVRIVNLDGLVGTGGTLFINNLEEPCIQEEI